MAPVEERHRLRPAADGTSALAHRCFLPQHRRDVLLPVQHSGRFQPIYRELGIRESMTEADIEIILERAKELHPGATPDHLRQPAAIHCKDFKEFIRISGMTHVRTSPYYPQSNGKIERWHKSLKGECIRPGTPLSLGDARRLVEGYVEHYNNVRLNSAVGYITPRDMLAGRQRGDPRRQRSKVGSGAKTTASSPTVGRMKKPRRFTALSIVKQPPMRSRFSLRKYSESAARLDSSVLRNRKGNP